MKIAEYFTKGKNYFIAIVAITALQALALLFAIYPKLSIDPVGIIKILIVIYAGYRLKLGFKCSAMLGFLLFLSVIWYVPMALPGIVFISGAFMIILNVSIVAALNILIYALSAMLGNLIGRKRTIKKKH
jgi:hypothetical protein